MEQGWDSGLKKFFIKVMNSVFLGVLWLIAGATAGIYFGLAYTAGKPVFSTIIFYVLLIATLAWLIRYYYRTWQK